MDEQEKESGPLDKLKPEIIEVKDA